MLQTNVDAQCDKLATELHCESKKGCHP